MDKLLKQHIDELEGRIQRLSQEMMQNRRTLTERNHLESELRVAQQALTHYQQAIKFEKRLQSPSA
jgi:predicted  nucleic acid-binding Zn-ribbon protein